MPLWVRSVSEDFSESRNFSGRAVVESPVDGLSVLIVKDNVSGLRPAQFTSRSKFAVLSRPGPLDLPDPAVVGMEAGAEPSASSGAVCRMLPLDNRNYMQTNEMDLMR